MKEDSYSMILNVAFAMLLCFLIAYSPLQGRTREDMQKTIALLSDVNKGDDAYRKIFSMGKEVIPLLIANSANKNIYEGSIVYDYTSSFLTDKPTIGLVSLFLIEAILNNELVPYHAPLILSEEDKFPYRVGISKLPRTSESNLEKAKLYYELWWEHVKDQSLEDIRKTTPLKNTDLRWF
jgi:hypothetical protein